MSKFKNNSLFLLLAFCALVGACSEDGTDTTTDGTDGTTATTATTSSDGTTATDATDGSTTATDATDATDGSTTATDATDATDGTDSTPVPPACPDGSSCSGDKCCTCSGVGCGDGLDNALSQLATLANGPLQESLDDGDVNLVAEFVGDTSDGVEFTMNMFIAELAASNADCDITKDTCDWELDLAAFDAECKPLIGFDNAVINGDKMTAGGPDGIFVLSLPIAGFNLEIAVTSARIEADVDTAEDGTIVGIDGILAGAVPKKGLLDAVAGLGDDLPISPAALENILNNVLSVDIDGLDADGNPGTDGEKESYSVGIPFKGIQANIAGVQAAGEGDEPACAEPPATFSETAFRMVELRIGTGGTAGEAVDVDGICTEPAEPTACSADGEG